jgi:DNA-binding LacI/PurR family transcriptional regulator
LKHRKVKQRLAEAKCVVAVTREPVRGFSGDLVVHQREPAIREVVEYLAKSGRKRPAMCLSLEQESNPPKFAAFRQACFEFGIADHPDLHIPLDFPDELKRHGHRHRQGVARAFDAGCNADAIFCFNDTGAIFVMRELQDRGIDVPGDIAVIGFNDTEVGQAMSPALATGDRRREDVASAIQTLLEARLGDPALPPQQHRVPMRFIWRPSAGETPVSD